MKFSLNFIFFFLTAYYNFYGQNPTMRNYTVNDGLASTMVYRAFQDSQGLMWFCTDKGISRFDGYKFETFTVIDGIPSNDVWQIAEDSQERVWFLSYSSHFFYFDLKTKNFVVIENPYRDLKDGHIWGYVQQSKDLYTAILSESQEVLEINTKTRKVQKFTPPRRGFSEYPFDTSSFTINRKHIGSLPFELRAYSEGFSHNLNKKKHPFPQLSIRKKFNDLFQHILTVIFDDQLTICASEKTMIQVKDKSVIDANVGKLSKYQDDKFVLIMNVGTSKYKLCKTEKDIFIINQSLQRVSNFDFLSNYAVNTVTFDNNDNLWICTKNQGIYFLSHNAINTKILNNIDGAVSCSFTYGSETWIGTNAGKIYYSKNSEKFIKLNFENTINLPINNLIVTPKYVVFTWQGLIFGILEYHTAKHSPKISSIFHPKNPFSLDFKVKLSDAQKLHVIQWHDIKSLDTTSSPNELIVSHALSISKLIFKEKECFSKLLIPKDAIAKAKVVKSISQNTLCIGNSRGLYVLRNKQIFNKEEDIIHKYIYQPILSAPINSIEYASQLQILFVGTNGYGLYFVKNGKKYICKELIGKIINHLRFDSRTNQLWVATNQGMYIIQHYKSLFIHYSILPISLNNGLPSLEVNQIIIHAQTVLVGTANGLVKYPLNIVKLSTTDDKKLFFNINAISINRTKRPLKDVFQLSYNENSIEVEYAGISFESNQKNTYLYSFGKVGEPKNWRETSALLLEFISLSPGNYELTIKCIDAFHRTSDIKRIQFLIRPPFWLTSWFIIAIILIFLGSIYLLATLRVRTIQRKSLEEKQIIRRIAALELEALQGQMNPHFVFNVLSSIQYYILHNNPISASSYLSKFSKLMRLFLESLRNKYISIEDEMVLLSNYLALEQLRFDNKFSFNIQVSADLSPKSKIPTMLIQPFVENAINHGISYSSNRQNTILVYFEKDFDGTIICTVEDDGIGRGSTTFRKLKKDYISRGIDITLERMKALAQSDDLTIDIKYIDKADVEDLKETGTIVKIFIKTT
ncbi:sensor histidine kinase [Arcicella rigui]|uniref:Sensor histidine kinase n=1 Tax=Arcicella rigui TaxID=797020 RepID=A0ABU5QAN5_9BACT|nr:sensor histidine kinase [Arcicella rigui]MEA5139910.1 sensor histidine kinase [Arcicella rigui]